MNRSVFLVFASALVITSLSGAIAEERKTAVEVKNTPNVAVTNTPNVAITNSPTVKIDPAANVVKTNTASNLIQLWTPWTQNVAPQSELCSEIFSTAGYKEMRVMVSTDVQGASANLSVQVEIFACNSSWVVGTANFAVPTHPITEQANFVQPAHLCMFSLPIYGNSYRIKVKNNTGAIVHIYSNSLVYLVN